MGSKIIPAFTPYLDITGPEIKTRMTKAEVMKSVSSYIKEKNLQIQEDRRKFLPNKELSKIFGIKNFNSFSCIGITIIYK